MKKAFAWCLALTLLLAGCQKTDSKQPAESFAPAPQLSADDSSFGESLEDLGVYQGYFEENANEITVTTHSGTADPYTLEGSTLTFTAIDQDTVCAISGTFRGNIVIDVGDAYKFDLELTGLSLVCDSTNPITVSSGSEVSLTAKKDTENYIYDMRAAIEDEALYSAAVYSLVDLEVCGKGSLVVLSENNNGIHTKDDLQVKNLTLTVACVDNALKGNDSVELENATTTLIASGGDGIKTTNTNISDKGNQRGTVSITGGTHTIYAACDGIDAAYDVVVDDSTTQLSIYTDKYSNYSQEVTGYASQSDSYEPIPPEAIGNQPGFDRTNRPESFGGMGRPGGGRGPGGMGGGPGGMGGMNEGNSEKSAYSTKGIKAGNAISILNGTVAVKAYDDALHANADTTLENGTAPTGNITVTGGAISLYSNDDGIHADGIAKIAGGTVNVIHSYEGLEGNTVAVTGGSISLISSDDGINATATQGQAITLSGGSVYVYAGGDGIDANSRSQYEGIVFAGADVVVISTGNGNSSIDTEQGYTYQSGSVLALMPSGGMSQEATHCQNYTSVATGANMSLSEGDTLTVTVNGQAVTSVRLPVSLSGLAIYLGSPNATFTTS